MPGFGVWVWTMAGRIRRNSRTSSTSARASSTGAMARVACASGTCSMPRRASASTYGPGAEAPTTR